MRFDMLGLIANDMEATARFYRLLGWNFPDTTGEPYVEVTLDNGLRISINSVEMMKSIDESWVEPVGQRMGVAFLCDSPAGVDSKYSEMTAAGYKGHKEPWDAFWGQRYAQIMDPDGNSVDLFAPLEG
jgi:uncharacterized glyoxalase superfamily protein PhnB